MKYEELTSDQQYCYDLLCELMGGSHHIYERIHLSGTGIEINMSHGSWSTFDGDLLTRLVLLCHQKCVRGEIASSGPGRIKLRLHRRKGREGRLWDRHPTIDEVLDKGEKS